MLVLIGNNLNIIKLRYYIATLHRRFVWIHLLLPIKFLALEKSLIFFLWSSFRKLNIALKMQALFLINEH